MPERRSATDYTKPSVIIVGLIAFLLLLLSVPVFLIFLPFAIVGLVVLYRIYANNMTKARKLARSHLSQSQSGQMDVELAPGISDALVMNDWGIVYATTGKKPVQMAWTEIAMVDEPQIAMLTFRGSGAELSMDLSQERYYLAIQAIQSRIRGRTNFMVDPDTRQSMLSRRLATAPLVWERERFRVSREGVDFKDGRMRWDEIQTVQEVKLPGEDIHNVWKLTFTAPHRVFSVESEDFGGGRGLGNNAYDLIKAVVEEQIPGRVAFDRPAPTPRARAIAEFERCRETSKPGVSLARKSGKFGPVEKYFRHMLTLLDQFSLEGSVNSRRFLLDYAELLKRTNRAAEAAALQARAPPD